MFLKIFLPILVIIFLIYLYLIAPKQKKRVDKRLLETKYAHRGLHGEGIPENSMRAFELAVENGYGIELDVRFSKDLELVVFHDATLKRVCGVDEKVSSKTKEELSKISLLGTDQTIPAFRDVLNMVNGRVPLLVEIKQDLGEGDVASAVCEMLKDYKGDLLIESFSPLALKTVKKLLPEARRGLLCDKFTKNKAYKKPIYYILQAALLNFLCRPDFIAYNHSSSATLSIWIIKNLFRAPFAAWTTRSESEEKSAFKKGYLTVIFENYKA